jgi:hypothetical protein
MKRAFSDSEGDDGFADDDPKMASPTSTGGGTTRKKRRGVSHLCLYNSLYVQPAVSNLNHSTRQCKGLRAHRTCLFAVELQRSAAVESLYQCALLNVNTDFW